MKSLLAASLLLATPAIAGGAGKPVETAGAAGTPAAAPALAGAAVKPAEHPIRPAEAAKKNPALVDVQSVIPDLVLDLRYATEKNFLGKQVYPAGARCLLLPETAKKLAAAAETLRASGYRLRVFDCYRPIAVQWAMWKILPKPGYVANPAKGSHHNRGAAVDLSLATRDGELVEMPTDFDTFSKAAHHGYPGGSEASRKHRETLRAAMESAGFRKNRMEWWHYSLPTAGKHPVLDEPLVPAN